MSLKKFISHLKKNKNEIKKLGDGGQLTGGYCPRGAIVRGAM
jgi:hypothetical protein